MDIKVEETLPSIYQSKQRGRLHLVVVMFGYLGTSITLDQWTSAGDFGHNVLRLTQDLHGTEIDVD
jgi:hypothetical protein